MDLSAYERAVLRRLCSDLHRQDPRLASMLTGSPPPGEKGAEVSWRPPRVAVLVAAVMLAAVSFMVAAVTSLMQPPCRPGTTGAQVTAGTAAPSEERLSGSSAHNRGQPVKAPHATHQTFRPTSPSRC
ncbi:DUF3040 domain-containing protein [Actinomadura sp. KC345]|nr:DUF3040 domain-containing protein [Actinomadura sp. KC345]